MMFAVFKFPPQVSREGESVSLGPNLKARGALEDWLTAMEENMRKVLHRFIKAALVDLEGINSNTGEQWIQPTAMQNATCAREGGGCSLPSITQNQVVAQPHSNQVPYEVVSGGTLTFPTVNFYPRD